MVQVNVCQKNKVDIRSINVLLLKCAKQKGNAIVGARIDKGGTTLFDDQVTCIQ